MYLFFIIIFPMQSQLLFVEFSSQFATFISKFVC
jgi:hypothetical protein